MSLARHPAQNHPQQVRRRRPQNTALWVDPLEPVDLIDDRRTPPDLLAECAALADVDTFDLDVAASADNAVAPVFYDREHDGLTGGWWGRVWCNPPYSDCASWIDKAHREAHRCDTIVMLLPANRTEQRWWQEMIEPARLAGTLDVRFLARRRRFDRPGWTPPPKGDRPPFGLCVVVWRGDIS